MSEKTQRFFTPADDNSVEVVEVGSSPKKFGKKKDLAGTLASSKKKGKAGSKKKNKKKKKGNDINGSSNDARESATPSASPSKSSKSGRNEMKRSTSAARLSRAAALKRRISIVGQPVAAPAELQEEYEQQFPSSHSYGHFPRLGEHQEPGEGKTLSPEHYVSASEGLNPHDFEHSMGPPVLIQRATSDPVWPARMKVASFFVFVIGLMLLIYGAYSVTWNNITVGLLGILSGTLGYCAAHKQSKLAAQTHWWIMSLLTIVTFVFNIVLGVIALRNRCPQSIGDDALCTSRARTFWIIIWVALLVFETVCNVGCTMCAKAHHRELCIHERERDSASMAKIVSTMATYGQPLPV